MGIRFRTAKLRKSCTDSKTLMKVYGPERGRILRRRLDQLRAAPDLEVMKGLPGHCHELSGNRKGVLAISLDGPYRLLFEPAESPPPQRDRGGLDWTAVTAICILDVESYHD
jgi:proteic killer suppression protein